MFYFSNLSSNLRPYELNNRKNSLLIITTVPETFHSILRGLPEWLSKYYSVTLVTSPESGKLKLKTTRNIKVIYIKMDRGITPVKDLVSIFKVISVIRKVKPEIIHSYTPKAGLIGMVSSAICKVKVRIHTFTGLIFPTQKGLSKRLLIAVDSLICKCATHVVPEGRGVAYDLLANSITTKELRIIGNGNIAGVDINHFSPMQRRDVNNNPSNSIIFCYIGRLSVDKGISELLISFDALPDSSKLIVAGALDERDPIKKVEFDLLVNHPRIDFRGWVEDIKDLLNSIDVLVLPSYREGFPNVLLQAGAMAKPVIASDVNGSNEIVIEGVNGWLVPARNSDALTKAMMFALDMNKTDLHNMGLAARQRIIENYEQSFYRRKLLEFYEDTLREAGC